jgi:predicted ATPase/Tfp pilus assembly protein PilF
MPGQLPSGMVTLLFTDVAGSTRLLRELGAEAYASALAEHRRRIRQACAAFGGIEVDTQGDAFFMAFPDARLATDAAQAFTESLATGPIRVRVGLHSGTPVTTDEGYVGEDVHLAARIAAAAHGGQIVLSGATRTLLDDGWELVDLGEHRLKDFGAPIAIYQVGHGSFPPLMTISNTNLPRPTSSFIGRERELAEILDRLVGGTRLLTLTGPGGTGKTRLAIEAANALIARYKSGVFWVGVAPLRDPALVTEQIAQTLGAKDSLAEHIGVREMLLVVDNLEQVIEAAPELSQLLFKCPHLAMLCTTRELLRVQGEVEFQVPPLDVTEAVALFCARSGIAASPEIMQLCTRLDSLPLAVELAAARTKALTPGQILTRVAQRLDLLRGGRDLDPRQRTLRATIEWSYDLLTAEEQRLYRALSVFAGGCTLEAAEEICDADLDVMESLVDKSLVRFSSERYLMLETIRQYASEQLGKLGEVGDLRPRHARWFTALVERSEPELEGEHQNEWLDRLDREHDNIRAALAYALDSGDDNVALRLAAGCGTFWWIRGYWSEARRWLDTALQTSQTDNSGLLYKTLEAAAHLAYRQGDDQRALQLALDAVQRAHQIGDASAIARALRVLALATSAQGDDEQFQRLVQQSADYARKAGDSWALLMALNNLGLVALNAGDLERASSFLDEALTIARSTRDRRSEAFVLSNLGLLELERGNTNEARRTVASSLRLAQQLRFLAIAASDLMLLAAVAATQHEPELAAQLLGGADRLNEEIGSANDALDDEVRARIVAMIQQEIPPDRYIDVLAHGYGQDVDAIIEDALAHLG